MVDQVGSRVEARSTWVRAAFWVGDPHDEAQFRAAINDDLIPALRVLPGVANAEVLWPRRLEDDPPSIYCQVLVFFPSRDALDQMLASPERAAMRGRVRELAKTFAGSISHIDYEVG